MDNSSASHHNTAVEATAALPLLQPVLVKDSDKDKAYLNHVLRMADSPSNFQSITQPLQAAPLERDHFIEVQHIVDIVLREYPTAWYTLKMGLFIDLATFVSDHRNLFNINKAFNQTKKGIPFAQYPTNATIQAYLAYRVPEGWASVQGSVKELVNEMVNRQGPYSDLTRLVGREVKAVMRW